MTKLIYNVERINSEIKNNLQNSIEYMNQAVAYSNFSCPSDFAYKNYLSSLSTELKNYKKNLEDCESWLISAINTTDSTFENLEKLANNLEGTEIIERKNSVTTV